MQGHRRLAGADRVAEDDGAARALPDARPGRPDPPACRAALLEGAGLVQEQGEAAEADVHGYFATVIDSGLDGWVPREQKMLKGHLPRVIYHRVYSNVRR